MMTRYKNYTNSISFFDIYFLYKKEYDVFVFTLMGNTLKNRTFGNEDGYYVSKGQGLVRKISRGR